MPELDPESTIPKAFFDTERQSAGGLEKKKVLLRREGSAIKGKELSSLVRKAALGLLSLDIRPNDRVAILHQNSPEWIIADLAVSSVGAVSVPIYPTLSIKEASFILNLTAATTIIFSPDQAGKIGELLKKAPTLKNLIQTGAGSRDKTEEPPPGTITMDELMEAEANPELLEERIEKRRPDDLFSIIFTSGTTGRPKGVELTHKNLLSNISAVLGVVDITADDLYLSYLPLSHIFERMIHHLLVLTGASIAYSSGFAYVGADALHFKPTVMTGVPFFFERIKMKILDSSEEAGGLKKRSLKGAIEGKKGFFARRAVKKVREKVGPRIRFFISGGAALSKETADFFISLGLPILEGYGLTETSPVISVNRLGDIRTGTVGKAIPGVEISIAAGDEIIVKGPGVMRGYYGSPEEDALVLKDDWFYTGDIGHIDDDGFLTITDRKKDIIITTVGKNISPQGIETKLKSDVNIKEALVYGNERAHLVALIIPETDRLAPIAKKLAVKETDPKELIGHPDIIKFFDERIKEQLKDLARFEQIRRFALIEDSLTHDRGEVTPTMKVRRAEVGERYASLINSLYD